MTNMCHFVSGPLILSTHDDHNGAALSSLLGTWPLLLVVFSTAAVAGVVVWALVSIFSQVISWGTAKGSGVERNVGILKISGLVSCEKRDSFSEVNWQTCFLSTESETQLKMTARNGLHNLSGIKVLLGITRK